MYTTTAHYPNGPEIIASGSLGDCHREAKRQARMVYALEYGKPFPIRLVIVITRQDGSTVATLRSDAMTTRPNGFLDRTQSVLLDIESTWRTFRRNMTASDIAFWSAVSPEWSPR